MARAKCAFLWKERLTLTCKIFWESVNSFDFTELTTTQVLNDSNAHKHITLDANKIETLFDMMHSKVLKDCVQDHERFVTKDQIHKSSRSCQYKNGVFLFEIPGSADDFSRKTITKESKTKSKQMIDFSRKTFNVKL